MRGQEGDLLMSTSNTPSANIVLDKDKFALLQSRLGIKENSPVPSFVLKLSFSFNEKILEFYDRATWSRSNRNC